MSPYPILFFTADPPGAIWQDKPQIARRLARVYPVIQAGPELHLRTLLAQRRAGHWAWADCWRPALTQSGPGLYHFHWSPWFPITGAALLGSITARLRRRRWQSVLRQLTIDQRPLTLDHSSPILWLFRPGMFSIIDQFNPRLVIYHVVDEYSAYPGLSPAQAARQRELDAALTRRADLVFCTAQSLVEARLPLNPNTHYLPNAVDFPSFQQALSRPPASLLPNSAAPRLGIVGGINAKIDLTLLAEIAESRPDWSLILVGPLSYGLDKAELARLQALSNVHLPGPTPPELVPSVIAGMDVCLIPYKLNEQTRHVNPLKLYEYLAAGKPVVATPLPELAQFAGDIHLAAGASATIAAIEQALAEAADFGLRACRQAIAAANTWDQRVERMLSLLQAALSASGH